MALAPKSYTAEAQLLINPASQNDTVLFSLPVLHASGDPTQDVLTASALVTTSQVASSVITRLNLHTTPSALLGKIQANPLAQSNIIAVQATAPTAARAQQLANAFAARRSPCGAPRCTAPWRCSCRDSALASRPASGPALWAGHAGRRAEPDRAATERARSDDLGRHSGHTADRSLLPP